MWLCVYFFFVIRTWIIDRNVFSGEYLMKANIHANCGQKKSFAKFVNLLIHPLKCVSRISLKNYHFHLISNKKEKKRNHQKNLNIFSCRCDEVVSILLHLLDNVRIIWCVYLFCSEKREKTFKKMSKNISLYKSKCLHYRNNKYWIS